MTMIWPIHYHKKNSEYFYLTMLCFNFRTEQNEKSEQLTKFHYHFHHYQNEQAMNSPQEGLKAK